MLQQTNASHRDTGHHILAPNPVAEFEARARENGVLIDHAIADDKINRVPVEGKGSYNTSGSYKLLVEPDGFAFGWAKNWVTGQHVDYCCRSPSPERDDEWRDRLARARATAECEREKDKADRLSKSMAEFHAADPCQSHPYFTEKGVPVPADCRVNEKGSALVPVYADGKPVGFERILAVPPADGPRKRHCSGGLTDGFHWADGTDDVIYVAEGIAKSMAVNAATGAKTFTSFGQGRLLSCAKFAREIHPDAKIIIAGDQSDDPTRGPQKAREAAAAVSGAYVLPPVAGEDWDDLLRLRGAGAVREALNPTALDGEVLVPGEGVQRHAIVVDDKSRPIWNMTNALTVLSTHYDWHGVFGLNQLTGKRVVFRALPGSDEKIDGWRDLMDDDYTAVQAWFNRNAYPRATSDITVNAVRAVSRAFAFDPLTSYLDGLRWDGKQRIDTWLTDYLGADDGPQRRAYGRKWLISAVARAYQPGCKADYMLVIEGDQGLRKSSVMRALAGGDWFSDNLPPMGTKDASEHLAGRWIIEVAELDSMNKAGIETAKAFITRQTESFRPAYGRESISQPRRCVFVGTTNRDNWLNDSSGGRRFWPVRVGHIDIEFVSRDRDQIWAEAVAAYRSGESWWLDGETEALARQDQAERLNTDPWQPDIAGYLSGKAQVAIADILWECLFIEKAKRTRGDSSRVTVVLQSLGWRRDGQFTSGTNKGQARYAPVH